MEFVEKPEVAFAKYRPGRSDSRCIVLTSPWVVRISNRTAKNAATMD
jgi:hypothetical protein